MNLDPDQPTNFLDLMRPPSGYRLDAAVGTTYSLDFVALTALLLAFVDGETDGGADQLNQIEVLRAITRLAHRVCLFVDRTHVSGAEETIYGRLSGMYDQIVREVVFEQGAFHPKVWVARYTPKATVSTADQFPLLRVVCASRNLTTSSSWEVFTAFEGFENGQPSTNGVGSEVAEFLRRIRRGQAREAALVERLEKALVRARFAPPSKTNGTHQFVWKWHGDPSLWQNFPPTGIRALVVSPFIRQSFLKRLLSGYDHLIVVSTQDELDALSDEFCVELQEGNELFVVRSARAEDDSDALQLHAKLYIAESASARIMFLGSANASESAWLKGNCEAMVSFAPGLAIDQFCNQFIYSPHEADGPSYQCWIKPYKRQALKEDDSARLAKLLDKAQKAVARLTFSAAYSRDQNILHVTCPTFARAQSDLDGCRLRLCPLTLFKRQGNLVSADNLASGGLEFTGVRLADLTDFLLVELVHAPATPRRFVVKAAANFDHLRADRDAEVLKEYLTPDHFRLFLRAILFDGVARSASPIPSIADSIKGVHLGTPQGAFGSLLGETTLEDILLSCTEDPDRVAEIDQLLQTFERTNLADEDFRRLRQFWQVFKSACDNAKGSPHE